VPNRATKIGLTDLENIKVKTGHVQKFCIGPKQMTHQINTRFENVLSTRAIGRVSQSTDYRTEHFRKARKAQSSSGMKYTQAMPRITTHFNSLKFNEGRGINDLLNNWSFIFSPVREQ